MAEAPSSAPPVHASFGRSLGGRTWGSVRFRITLGVTVLFAVSLSVAAVLFVSHVQRSLVDEIYAQDVGTLEQLSDTLTGNQVPSVLDPPTNRPGTQIQLVDTEGHVVGGTPGVPKTPYDTRLPALGPSPASSAGPTPASSVPNGQANAPANGRPPPVPEGNLPPGRRPPPLGPDGRPLPGPVVKPPRPVTSIVPNPGGSVGGASNEVAISAVPVSTSTGSMHLIAATSLAGVQNSVDTLGGSLAIAIPILVVLIAIAAWIITSRALRPVREMTAQVEAISASTLHERVPQPRANDEIGHLAQTMNAMLERLETASVRQRQFVSDASHELRTPVSSIRVELEVALMHPEQADWHEVASNILAEDERLEQIVGDLLTLARFDERPTLELASTGEVELDAIVRQQVQRARPLPVECTELPPVRVRGRSEELSRMLGHLVDNAARHGRSVVRVSLGRVGPARDSGSPVPGWILLLVDDDGAGVPEDERATIFDRFGRLQEGRARDSGGAGLGLAVVQRIVERHGGMISVGTSPLGGARFAVTLPES